MKTRFNYILLTLVSMLSTSCVKEKLEDIYNKQEDRIDTYIQGKSDALDIVYNGGSSRVVTVEGDGEALAEGGTVSFYYAGYVFSGSKSSTNMFTTNHRQTAEKAGWNLTDAEYGLKYITLGKDELLNGLKNGLVGVKAGETCEILFSGKYGFGKKPIGTIPANSALLFEIWVEAVSNE